jgi:hypothetical protein
MECLARCAAGLSASPDITRSWESLLFSFVHGADSIQIRLLAAGSSRFLENMTLTSIGKMPVSDVEFGSTTRKTFDPSILESSLRRLDMRTEAGLWSFAFGCSRGEVRWTFVYSFPDCSGRFGIYRASGRSARDAVQRGQYSGKRGYANFFM